MSVLITGTDADLQYGGWVGQTSGGVKYSLFRSTGGDLMVHKNIDGTPTLEGGAQTRTTVLGTGTADIQWVTAALDSTDDLMVVAFASSSGSLRAIAWRIFDTGTDAWLGSWAEIEAYDQPPVGVAFVGGSLSCRSDDDFDLAYMNFVKFMGTDRAEVFCTTYTGTWSSRVDISTTAATSYKMPKLTVKSSDNAEAFYFSGVGAASAARNTRTSGTWGSTESNYAMGLGGQTLSVTATGSTVYRYHMSGYSGQIGENNSSLIGNENIFHGAAYLDEATGDRYFINSESNAGGADLEILHNDGGGWVTVGDIQAGTTEEWVRVGWSFNNLNNAGSIDYIFGVGTVVHWDEYSISGPVEVLAAALVVAASNTPDTVVLTNPVDVLAAASAVAASSTPDTVALLQEILTAASSVAISVTPDTVDLANAIMAAASVLAQSNTPDTVPLLKDLAAAASAVAVSNTPDTVVLLKDIIAQVTIVAASNTPAPTLSLEILGAASAIAISNTNDLVVLANIIEAAASVLASSSTNDAVKLILEHAVSVQVLAASNTSTPIMLKDINAAASAIAASLTPNDGVLGITLPTSASILAISDTSDLVELVTSGIIFASALVQAASNTSTPILALELLGAAAIQAISNTPDTVNLSTAGEILAAALVAANSATSDTSMLALSIPTSASINAASATGIPALIKSIAVSVGIDAASQTPDTVPMLREVSASALAEAASNTSDPTLGILMLVAAAVGAVSVTNDNVTLIVSSAQGVVTATVSVGVPGITGTAGLPTITGSAGVPGISAETP